MQSATAGPVVHFAEAARAKILELATASGARGRAVRIYAEARGCGGGPVYGMSFDNPTPSDLRIEVSGLTLVVDLESLAWVSGLRIDYRSAAEPSGGFIFSSTNGSTGASDSPSAEPPACGCSG